MLSFFFFKEQVLKIDFQYNNNQSLETRALLHGATI